MTAVSLAESVGSADKLWTDWIGRAHNRSQGWRQGFCLCDLEDGAASHYDGETKRSGLGVKYKELAWYVHSEGLLCRRERAGLQM